MNTPSPESPRLVCRVVRWWAALTDSSASAPSGEPTTGHRAHCPSCRAYFKTTAALETHLRHTARTQMPAAPAGLEHRIADAVRRAQVTATGRETSRATARAPQRRAAPLWAAGLAATAAVTLVMVLNRESPRVAPTAEVEPAEIAALFSAVTTFPQQLNKVFAPGDARQAVPDPLSRELDNVKADARSALNFLAENFLPSARSDPTSTLHNGQPALLGS